MSVSIIIPVYNRAALLVRVLPSYLLQKHVHEVLIVDDGSDEPVEASVRALVGELDERVRFVRVERSVGLPAARNLGLEHVEAAYVLFGEDDVELAPNYVEALLAAMHEYGAAFTSGRLLLQHDDESMTAAIARARASEQSPGPRDNVAVFFDTARFANDEPLPFTHAISMAKRETYLRYRFNARLMAPTFMREDQELQLRVVRDGGTGWLVASTFALHLHKSRSEGGGTRRRGVAVRRTLSAGLNTWDVVSEHAESIAPFFPGLPAFALPTLATSYIVALDAKRQIFDRYPTMGRLLHRARHAAR